MILADKIIELRKKNNYSQEDLAERLGVSRQSVSKWEGAQSIPDMNKILSMSELFGVSTDFLLKDELNFDDSEIGNTFEEITYSDTPLRGVSLEEANAFLTLKREASVKVSLGVMLCIISPVVLIVLSAMSETGRFAISGNTAAGIGMIILMLMIGVAVFFFVTISIKLSPFSYMESEALDTAYGIDGMIKEKYNAFRHVYTGNIAAGIVLCVLSCVWLFIGLALDSDDLIMSMAVAMLLVMVGIGVWRIVGASITMDSYKQLLEIDSFTRERKADNRKNEKVSGIYWSAALVLYLAWSFITMDWGHTWIVWPIAGVAYGLLCAVLNAVRRQ